MTQKLTKRCYLDALNDHIMIFDGAMGTNLQKMNLTAKEFGGEKYVGCNDYLVLSYPQAVEQVHRSFLEVGVDVIETCSFRANRLTLKEYGLQDKVTEINKAAASLARKLADEFSTPDHLRFVAGSMGPSGKLPSMDDPELSNITIDDLIDIAREQATGLIEGGVDLLLIETSQDILEVKAVIHGIHTAFTETGVYLPIQAQVTLDTTGRMLLGTDITAVLAILQEIGIDVIGLNCSTGPEHMREPIQYLGERSSLPVSCIPNAGLPLNIDGQAVYPLQPESFANELTEFIEKYHINVVGGCCGTTPEHLQQLVEKVGGRKQLPRPILDIPELASAIQAQPMNQQPKPFLIGERLNTQGSQKFKELILNQNFDGILSIARQQVNSGAHGLDICVALTERADESESMQKAIKKLASVIRVPLVIDSTEPDVIETALKNAPGRCLINSTNLEGGTSKADRIFSLARKYNAAVICLTIDEKGMAKTADRKLEIAKRLVSLATNEYGLHPSDLVIDSLTFTLATGDPEYANSAVETLEGLRKIKSQIPGVLTSLGASNLSFGLPPNARSVLNSVFLYHAVLAGLDMAIVNPALIQPYIEIPENTRKVAEDLIFNRAPNALKLLIEFFQQTGEIASKPEKQASELQAMTAEARLAWRILHRYKDGVDTDIDEIIHRESDTSHHQTAVAILNSVLLPAMKTVGDKFGTGELILPFVLQSAEVMKIAVTHLEKYLEKKEGISKGTLVLATVYGDVHDIGKNLVKTILSNNGYTVVDLGKQVPAETIISKAAEVNATAIGLSALLVSTSKQMPLIVNELHRRNLKFPVLVGGAAINRRFARRISRTDSGEMYKSGVFYCKDAFEGLSVMDELSNPETRVIFQEKNQQEAEAELTREHAPLQSVLSTAHSKVTPALQIPLPPKWGVHVVNEIPLDSVFPLLSINELYRLSWGAKNTHGMDWEKLSQEFDQRLENMRKNGLKEKWLHPQGVYGYFPAQSEGNDLIIYEPGSVQSGTPLEWVRFSFPRQNGEDLLCLADYFLPAKTGKMDLVAFQVVTVGKEASEKVEKLQAKNDYTEAYFTHGLSVQLAEATAEYLHRFIRHELGLADDQGKRYSWGYPAVPDLSDHAKVFQLLPVETELGMHLTEAFQLVPEQSTAAIVIHHPQSRYFNVA